MKLQIIITALFVIFHMVYYFIPTEELVCEIPPNIIYWSLSFFIAIYSLVAGLLWFFVKSSFAIFQKLYFIVVFIYFIVLIGLNVVCVVDIDLYGPLLIKTGKITIPFVVIMTGLGALQLILLIKKRSQKP